MTKTSDLRERIYHFYEKHGRDGNQATIRHFTAEGVPRQTIYNIIQRFKKGISAKRIKGSGRPAKKMPRKSVKRLRRFIDHSHGKSQRTVASKFGISQSYVNLLLKES